MIVRITTTDNFRREAKKLIKKYRSLKNELLELSKSLENDPRQGTKLTEDTYKIRLAVKSKGKGKSGGLRIITHLYIRIQEEKELTEIFLLSIFDKSDYANISDKFLQQLIKDIQDQLEDETVDNKSSSESNEESESISEEE